MATLTEEEIEFKSQFKGRGYATGTRTEKRLTAERRAAMTDRQLSRGRPRPQCSDELQDDAGDEGARRQVG